ncbi:TnsA endonuclease [Serratia proteamaculans]|uniref:TnsA endonuclease N-terminal domain-containing protein n=1 Tax=Serratia proteamaculans TaxID=28151 RepID=UPI0009F7D7B5|nr:TnsA endonuclease N-terminal domain-containing protein [Serratia proteamaculans]SMB54618.1 TnsA endonuclease [Serratia proteamaculans]HBV28688.1 heteromeric transposase endonuclease subunit TnsA [Shigella sp.]
MYRNKNHEVIPKQQRKIKPTRRSVSGMFPFRGHTPVAFESTLERDFLILTEFSMVVLDIIPQPAEIPFKGLDGRNYSYTPDFLVYYYLGEQSYKNYPRPRLVEVKPEEHWRAHWREWLPKWKAAWRYAQTQGWEFHIHDESRIRNEALKNIRTLARYKNTHFELSESERILATVREVGSASVDYLLSRLFLGMYRPQGIAHIWHLVAIRQLDCDISQPLTMNTELWVTSDDR